MHYGLPLFILALPFSGNKSNICPSLHPSDWAYPWAACLDATMFELCGRLLPVFPLNQQPYPQAAGQYLEDDHPGSDGQKWVGSLI